MRRKFGGRKEKLDKGDWEDTFRSNLGGV